MKIILIPWGSHGDVHPLVGIGIEMARRGHDVALAANALYEPLAERSRLRFVPMGTVAEFREVLEKPQVWDTAKGLPILLGAALRFMRPQYDLIRREYVEGQTVVVAASMAFGARLAQEKLGVPLATIMLAPSGLRSIVDPMVFPDVPLPRWTPGFIYRMLFWWADQMVLRPVLDGPLNAFRTELGLPAVSRPLAGWWNSPERILCLFPEWFGSVAPDWPAQTRLCGFPLFDERGHAELPADLASFLDAGDAPIIFTPGSAMAHGHAFFRAAMEACQILKRRAIFLTMYPEQLPPMLPDSIRHFRYIPFSDVFPRAAVVVHHGGIGTTSQGLAAGVPQLITPMGYDQPDNAYRLEKLGVGASLAMRRVTAANFVAKLHPLLQPEVRERCKQWANRLATEQPLHAICQAIEELIPHGHHAIA